MNKTSVGAFVVILVIGIVSLAGVIAYQGSPLTQGPRYDSAVHEQLEAAMAAGDYDAWLRIRQENNLPMKGRVFQVVNKDNFDRYVAMHNANLAGDSATADAIRAELGLGQGMHGGKNRGSVGCDGTRCGTGTGAGAGARGFVDANNDGICDHKQ
jgi:hypothetical protein